MPRLIRHLIVLGATGALVAAIGFSPSPGAFGDTSTNANACLSSATNTYAAVDVSMSGTASPGTVAPGGTVTLTGTSLTVSAPGELFLAGYRLGLLSVGSNSIPVSGTVTISASNTTQGSQTITLPATTATVTITDPTPANKTSGDESASAFTATLALPNTMWTAGSSGTISFSQTQLVVNATLAGGVITVTLTCQPGTPSADGTTFTPATPTPFETVTIQSATTTTGSTTTTGATTTTTGATTTTTGATTTTTGATTTTTHPTTTTTAPTTTTTGATTTTTHATTTTTAPTTTTTHATTTTTAPTTTTTAVIGARPGWGFGDGNHIHTGPPGLMGGGAPPAVALGNAHPAAATRDAGSTAVWWYVVGLLALMDLVYLRLTAGQVGARRR